MVFLSISKSVTLEDVKLVHSTACIDMCLAIHLPQQTFCYTWIEACASKYSRTAFFRVVTQRVVVIPYRHFGKEVRNNPEDRSSASLVQFLLAVNRGALFCVRCWKNAGRNLTACGSLCLVMQL